MPCDVKLHIRNYDHFKRIKNAKHDELRTRTNVQTSKMADLLLQTKKYKYNTSKEYTRIYFYIIIVWEIACKFVDERFIVSQSVIEEIII